MLKILFLLTLIPLFSFSQVKYEKKISIEIEKNWISRYVKEFGENGLLFRYEDRKRTNRERKWHYRLYNKNLKLQNEKSVTIPSNFYVETVVNDSIRNYTLFKKSNKFSLVTFNSKNCNLTKISGVFPKKFLQDNLIKVKGDIVYIKGKIKRTPTLLTINWKTGEQKSIPLLFDGIKSKKLIDFQLAKNTKEILLYFSDKSYKDKRTYKDSYIRKIDDKGNYSDLINLTQQSENRLINVKSTSFKNNSTLFLGEWANKSYDRRGFSTNELRENSGVYFCKIDGNKVDFLKFIKTSLILSELAKNENWWKKSQGINHFCNYKLIIKPDGYIVVLEISEKYYFKYTTEFIYKGAFIVKFALNGDFLWHHALEIQPLNKPHYSSRNPSEFGKISLKSRSDFFNYTKLRFISVDELNNNYLKLTYESEKKIINKIFDESGNIIVDTETEEIITFDEDVKLYRDNSKIVHWFDKCFIAIIRKNIKNSEFKSSNKKKQVYSISKILYN